MNRAKKTLLLPEQAVCTPSYPAASSRDAAVQAGLLTRALLVAVLSLTLVGAMRWALNITNANARQISTNLTHIQDRYEQQAPPTAPRAKPTALPRPNVGPTLEPE